MVAVGGLPKSCLSTRTGYNHGEITTPMTQICSLRSQTGQIGHYMVLGSATTKFSFSSALIIPRNIGPFEKPRTYFRPFS